MPRLRAVVVLASVHGTFHPGQEFDLDDEATADAWVAAGAAEVVEAAASAAIDPDSLTVPQLQAALAARDLSAKGRRAELVERLATAIAADAAPEPEATTEAPDDPGPEA